MKCVLRKVTFLLLFCLFYRWLSGVTHAIRSVATETHMVTMTITMTSSTKLDNDHWGKAFSQTWELFTVFFTPFWWWWKGGGCEGFHHSVCFLPSHRDTNRPMQAVLFDKNVTEMTVDLNRSKGRFCWLFEITIVIHGHSIVTFSIHSQWTSEKGQHCCPSQTVLQG